MLVDLTKSPIFITALVATTGICFGEVKTKDRPSPGTLEVEALVEFEALDSARQALVRKALDLGRQYRLNQYLFGSADPSRGGFDCSGSMYFVLTKQGLEPPRSSAAQFEWILASKAMTRVQEDVSNFEAKVFDPLKPGDLLFWTGTYQPTDGRKNKITHVQMYLGTEKRTGNRVMIGSSDGRSYCGTARCGFGVFDFKLPRPSSKARFAGFGPPPGLLDAKPVRP